MKNLFSKRILMKMFILAGMLVSSNLFATSFSDGTYVTCVGLGKVQDASSPGMWRWTAVDTKTAYDNKAQAWQGVNTACSQYNIQECQLAACVVCVDHKCNIIDPKDAP